MTGLLVAIAIGATVVLILSAARTGAAGTAGDENRRGPWGIAVRNSTRNRDLNPHQRRWQTALLSGRNSETRWKDVVAEIELLERLCGISADRAAPSSHDSAWIDQRIHALERSVRSTDDPGEPTL